MRTLDAVSQNSYLKCPRNGSISLIGLGLINEILGEQVIRRQSQVKFIWHIIHFTHCARSVPTVHPITIIIDTANAAWRSDINIDDIRCEII